MVLVSVFQKSPGYLDADYYFAGGQQLFSGKGFTEPYLWNYLDNPSSLPHPSNTYWMPFASILAAMGMRVFNQDSWQIGRLFFQGTVIAIPLITYNLAYTFHQKRNLALASGFLAIFCGYYLVYLTTTDTFGIYILAGGVFFLLARSNFKGRHLLIGMISGIMYLSRSDGLIWLVVAIISLLLWNHQKKNQLYRSLDVIKEFSLIITGFLLVAGWWFVRNYQVFGLIFPPGNFQTLWLTHYNQIFTIDPARLTFSEWIKAGLPAAIKVRNFAAGVNLQNAIAAQGSIFLTPLILIAAWKLKQDPRIQMGAVLWFLIFVAMSFIFPFAGPRGGFFHSSASLQVLNWSLAPIGLETSVGWIGRRRGWAIRQATKVFLILLVFISIVFSGYISTVKLYSFENRKTIWNSESERYKDVYAFLKTSGASQNSVVLVANPPGFFLESGLQSVAVPDGAISSLFMVAGRFSADYLILEEDSLPDGLRDVYKYPDDYVGLKLLGKVENALIFKFGY